jgi:two-component system, LytTR family, response regulator
MADATRPPLTVVLVDDEPLVREGLRQQLAALPCVRVLGEASDGLSAVAAIEALRPQLVLLDVQMPELDGFQVLQQLDASTRPAVVFVTAFDRYALRAFEVHAVDYLLKPFDTARLHTALARAHERLQTGRSSVTELLAADCRDRGITTFCARAGDRLRLVAAAEVDWLEARGNYVLLHHPDGEFLVRDSLQNCATGLAGRGFLRVHRSAIVRLDAVVDLRRLPGGDFRIRTRCGGELVLSRTFRDAFERAVGRRL